MSEWLVGEWDGSALEFRVAGHMSRDPQILDDIVKGHDVHRFTGSVLYAVRYDDVTDDQRQAAKPHTFKPVYGGTSGTKRERAYYAAFKERYHVLARKQDEWVMEVLQHKELVTEWGMRYYWPRARMSRDGYVNVKSQVYNYPVQAFATAEIIPIALAFFMQMIQGHRIVVLNTVHDSVVCRVHVSETDFFVKTAVDVWHKVYAYLAKVYGITDFYIPLGTEVVLGTHWGDKKGRTFAQKFNIWPDGRVEEVA